MIRFYSIFVATEDLMSSPFIHDFSSQHDLTLRRGQPEIVNFLLQQRMDDSMRDQIYVAYEPASLELRSVDVALFPKQTLLTAHITPLEIGSHKIGFSFPVGEDENSITRLSEKNIGLQSYSIEHLLA